MGEGVFGDFGHRGLGLGHFGWLTGQGPRVLGI